MSILILINSLILMGLLLLGNQSDVVIFLCCGVGAGAGIYILYLFIRRIYSIRLTWLLASSLLIGYAGGCVATLLANGLSGNYEIFAVFGIPSGYAGYALALVNFSCALLLAGGFFENPVLGDTHIVRASWKFERFLWAMLGVIAVAYFLGELTYEGATVQTGTQKVSILGSVSASISPILPALAVIGLLQSRGLRRVRYALILLLSFIALLPSGRRVVIYAAVLCLFSAFWLSGWKVNLTSMQKILLTAFLAVVFIISNISLMAVRMASDMMGGASGGGSTELSMSAILPIVFNEVINDPQAIRQQLSENYEERPLYLEEYLALLGRGGQTPSPLWGRDVALGFRLVIPDLLYKALGQSKAAVREIGTEEDLANEHFGLYDSDDANSILTSGIIDFGLVGVMLYPLLLCVAYRWIFSFLRAWVDEEGLLLAVLYILFVFLQTEAAVSSYIIWARDLIIAVCIWRGLYALPTLFHVPVARPEQERLEGYLTEAPSP
ncbi:MAG: hypothetical protein ACRD3N_19750 [Terracidiphilus sp.]